MAKSVHTLYTRILSNFKSVAMMPAQGVRDVLFSVANFDNVVTKFYEGAKLGALSHRDN